MHLNPQKLFQFNTNIVNIHPMSMLLFEIGVKIAAPTKIKGSPDKHGNSEEKLRETTYE